MVASLPTKSALTLPKPSSAQQSPLSGIQNTNPSVVDEETRAIMAQAEIAGGVKRMENTYKMTPDVK